MMTLLFVIIFIPALILLAVTLWNVLCSPRVGARTDRASAGAVSILIPARDEEANIATCLDHALAQGSVLSEVLVYDDHSTDATSAIVAERAQHDARVRLLTPQPLPAGWCGKTFACAQLAAEASAPWLLFVDADALLSGNSVSRAVAEAEAREVSLLSCWPRLEMGGFWERALMPLLNFVVFTLYPAPLALKRNTASLGLAHGSFMLARRDAYQRTGGHTLVRAELFEDTRLAQVWRECAERSLCLDGQDMLRVRMYNSFGEIWRGFQKNFFPAFRGARSFWLFIALHFSVFLLPFLLLPLAPVFIFPVLCVLLMRLALVLRFKHPLWSVLLHPLSESVLLALGISSWLHYRRGRGVEWKGRRYGHFALKGVDE
ncbi:MAG TPA: glycosyltransferase [Pyrinomonadaceae bacterium]|nr:glycosyltransferase [Pyrinomonadaceae bacterium]